MIQRHLPEGRATTGGATPMEKPLSIVTTSNHGRPTPELRLTRVLQMLRMLSEHPWPRADLARELGVSERQVARDIRVLRAAGCRVARRRATGYYLVACPVCNTVRQT